jgi:hypothetical protein
LLPFYSVLVETRTNQAVVVDVGEKRAGARCRGSRRCVCSRGGLTPLSLRARRGSGAGGEAAVAEAGERTVGGGGTSETCGAGAASGTARPQRASDGVEVEGSACWSVRDGLGGGAAIAGCATAAGASEAKRTRSGPDRSRGGGPLNSAGTALADSCATRGKATGCRTCGLVELVGGVTGFGGRSNGGGGRDGTSLGNEDR